MAEIAKEPYRLYRLKLALILQVAEIMTGVESHRVLFLLLYTLNINDSKNW